jgi:hypothetical protein
MSYNSMMRLKNLRFGTHLPKGVPRPTAKGGAIISWSGMRGIVSLAAALALPSGFPERDLIQFIAFTVVLGTLVIQGSHLDHWLSGFIFPKIIDWTGKLRSHGGGPFEAAITALEGNTSPYAGSLRLEYQAVLDLGEALGNFSQLTDHERLRLKAIGAARAVIEDLRVKGEIGDIAFERVDEAIDRAYLYAIRFKATG